MSKRKSDDKISANITEALNSLGSTVDEVRATLAVRKIKGGHSSQSCPVAIYLTQTLGLLAHVSQGSSGVSKNQDEYYGVPNPIPVAHFVARFDRDEFPELDTSNASVRYNGL